MPFDSKSFPEAEVDLSGPSLAGTSYLLRHPELWPKGFTEFDYRRCKTCAMGLIVAFWNDGCWPDPFDATQSISGMLSIAAHDVHRLFAYANGGTEHDGPNDVADRIDTYLSDKGK